MHRFNSVQEKRKLKFRNKPLYIYNHGHEIELKNNRIRSYKKHNFYPPKPEQLKKLERLYYKAVLYGIPCRLEMQKAIKSSRAAASTILRLTKRIQEVEHGNL